MSTLPVDNLNAITITLNDKQLVDNAGVLSFDNKLLLNEDQLTEVSVVSTDTDRDLLMPKEGDVCKVTSDNNVYIFDGSSWILLQNEDITVHIVSTIDERDLLNPNNGDYCNVTSENQSYVYNNNWISILSNNIDDTVISEDTTWSSTKIDYELSNRNIDGGLY